MIFKSRNFRHDLMGRRPTPLRPTTVLASIVLGVSLLAVVAAVFYAVKRSNSTRKLSESLLGSASFPESSVPLAPAKVDLSHLAEHVERDLQRIGDSIAILFTKQLQHPVTSPTTYTDLSWSNKHETVPLQIPSFNLEQVRRSLRISGGLPNRNLSVITDGDSLDTVALIPQYHLATEYEQLISLGDSIQTTDSSWKKRVAYVGAYLAKCYDSLLREFPAREVLRVKDSVHSLGVTKSMIAHVYCALDLSLWGGIGVNDSFQKTKQYSSSVENVLNKLILLDSLNCPTIVIHEKATVELLRSSTQKESVLLPSDTTPHLLIGYPSSILSHTYDCALRPWFREAMVSTKPVWSSVYEDHGTGISVITISQRILDRPGGSTIGVVAIDFLARRFSAFNKPGYAYLANFSAIWICTIILLGIIVASTRTRFDPLLWSFCSMLVYYTFIVWVWASNASHSIPSIYLEASDAFLSMFSSILFFLAAIRVFPKFKHHTFRRTDKLHRPRFLSAIVERIESSSLMTELAGGIASAVLSLLFTISIGIFTPSSLAVLRNIDALLGLFAMGYLGYEFTIWSAVYCRRIVQSYIVLVFFTYAIAQVFVIQYYNEPLYWYVLLVLKTVAFASLIIGVYSWIQFNSYERVRGTGSRSIIISRTASPPDYFIIAGNLSKDEIWFVDVLTLLMLGVRQKTDLPMDVASQDRQNEYIASLLTGREILDLDLLLPLNGWESSEFGKDLLEPTGPCWLHEFFDTESWRWINRIFEQPNSFKERVRLENNKVDRVTSKWFYNESQYSDPHSEPPAGSKLRVPLSAMLHGQRLEDVDVKFTQVTVWSDADCLLPVLAGDKQFENTDKYVIICGCFL